jgi:hypothetical protein
MITRLNPGKIAFCDFINRIGMVAAGTLAVIISTEPVGAFDFAGQAAAQVPASSLWQAHYTGKKHRHPPRKRTKRTTAKYGRHLYPYPYYPPCPYYFPAYGTYPCVAQGYYPNPPYSHGFGFGGPFWGGGIFDDD